MNKLSIDKVFELYINTHAKSQEFHERSVKHFAADGATHFGRIFNPFRPYITRAEGCRKWDIDGNEYIDYVTGHGALILGHSHCDIVKAVKEQMTRGTHYGDNHLKEIEWAELIKSMMPKLERVEYFACGQEANMMAIRLARVFTKRKKILRFVENYHGWADELSGPGEFGTIADYVDIIPMNNINIVEERLSTKEYAIMLLEGGGAHMGGQIPYDVNFVRHIPELAQKYGTVFLIDEIVTGFRDAPGGWQSLIGITSDLTSLGKCVSGGLAVGILGGRVDIMNGLKPKEHPQQFVAHAGTWNANPVVCAAGIAACKNYINGEPQRKANEMGAYLRDKGNEVLKQKRIKGHLYGRNIIHLYLGPIEFEPDDPNLPPTRNIENIMAKNPARLRMCLHLLQRGISTPDARLFIVSAAHTKIDIDKTIEAFEDTLDIMLKEGSLNKL